MDYKVKDCGLDGLTFTEPSLCKFEFAADCDLKNIIDRFLQTGELPGQREAANVDVTTAPSDFMDLCNGNIDLQRRFDSLPPDERQKFADAGEWLASLDKPVDDKPVDDKSAKEDNTDEPNKVE